MVAEGLQKSKYWLYLSGMTLRSNRSHECHTETINKSLYLKFFPPKSNVIRSIFTL